MGRLRSVDGGGAWCPATMVSNFSKEWLEVDLEKKMMITGISLQGRWDNGIGQEFAPFVCMMYYDDVTEQFVPYSALHGEQVMAGNTDTYSVAEVKMVPPVVTGRIRVIPYSQYQRSVCIRVELRGCQVPLVQAMDVEQEVVGEHARKWGSTPILIGILLTTSILLMVVTICMYMRMNKRKQETTGHPIYSLDHQAISHYQSNLLLQTQEPIYQEPIIKNAPKVKTLKPNNGYSITKISQYNSTYSIPPHSRLPSTPSFHTFKFPRSDDIVTFTPIYYQ